MSSIKIPKLHVAKGFWQRFMGLMFSQPLSTGACLLILRCNSIHTFFMRYALDVVYLDGDGTVVKLVRNLGPWQMSWGGRDAKHVAEFTAGGIEFHNIRLTDCLPIVSGLRSQN